MPYRNRMSVAPAMMLGMMINLQGGRRMIVKQVAAGEEGGWGNWEKTLGKAWFLNRRVRGI